MKTLKPSGLKITRKNNTYTLAWKIADKDYGAGQWFDYMINDTGKDSWHKKPDKIGDAQTQKSIVVDRNNYYPKKTARGAYKKKLFSIKMRVKGERKKYTTGSGDNKKTHDPTVSDWSVKEYEILVPNRPTLNATLDNELTNVCVFAWNTDTKNDSQRVFTDVEYQSMLVKNNAETDGSKLSWKNATKDSVGASGSRTVIEDTDILYQNGNSYVRWVRVRSRGPRGNSDWRYAFHVYALTNQAKVKNVYAEETEEGGFQCNVEWNVGSNRQNPIDKTTVQYTIVIPDEDLTCPSGASWTDANISKDTVGADRAVFSIDDQLSKDQCLFVRVNTQHDTNITYGEPQLAKVGFLKDPSNLTVQTNNTTHRATVQATNNSDVEDSVMVVRYIPAIGEPIDCGIIPHGSNSVTVQCPDWDSQTAIAFDVHAMVGEYEKQDREDDVDAYSIDERMRSLNYVTHGGSVPVAPQDVKVLRTDVDNTVRVLWSWSWEDANSAEISWSDHRDAWESTDEPETYVISNLHASQWNISNLELGKTWYIRVRLISGTEDVVTYGPWSDIEYGIIDLSSAPNKSVLLLGSPIIPAEGSTTASWVYTSQDGTDQEYAEVAIFDGTDYEPIAHASTQQHVELDAETSGFEEGQIYNLACRVRSASGQFSEWSDVVSITVAEPLECSIANTSLVDETIEVNPRTFESNPATFDTEIAEEFAEMEISLEPIQLGEETPSPSNVRPIVGHSEVEAKIAGKNLLALNRSPSAAQINNLVTVITQTKDVLEFTTLDSGTYANVRLTYTLPVGTYTLSIKATSSDNYVPVVSAYNGNTLLANAVNQNTPKSFTLSEETTINIRFFGSENSSAVRTVRFYDVQLEKSSTATDYVPYVEPVEVEQDFNVTLTPTVIDETPYLFKKTGDVRGDRESLELVGGTVNWNQIFTAPYPREEGGITITRSEDLSTLTINGTAIRTCYFQILNRVTSETLRGIIGHVYYINKNSTNNDYHIYNSGGGLNTTNADGTCIGKATTTDALYVWIRNGSTFNNLTVQPIITDLTAFFGNSATADYVYSLEQTTAGAGIAWLRKYFPDLFAYSPYNAGTLESVKPTAHVTRGMNQWDEEWETGTIGSNGQNGGGTSSFRSKNYIPVLPNTDYYIKGSYDAIFWYDADKNLISIGYSGGAKTSPQGACYLRFYTSYYGATYEPNTDQLCINISNESINGKYYPSDHHTYPITELELRGIPKLVDGELRFDGDTRKADGSVGRKYGYSEFDGSSDELWAFQSINSYGIANFYINLQTSSFSENNMCICDYKNPQTTLIFDTQDEGYFMNTSSTLFIRIKSTTASDISQFRTWLSSNKIRIAWVKATPTTETADPFTDPQVCDPYGTEEYVSSNGVPVGNKTTYKTRDIFGGKIDLASGVLTVAMKTILLDGTEDLWTAYPGYETQVCYLREVFYGAVPKKLLQPGWGISNYMQCVTNILAGTVTAGQMSNSTANSGRNLYVTYVSGITTLSAWKEYLANHPLQLCYELAEPLTYQLTPHEIETLIGSNVVTTEDGGLTVRIAESIKTVKSLKRLPLTVTVEGAGEGETTTVVVERADQYELRRPDDNRNVGHKGETILLRSEIGNDEMSFDKKDEIGSFDDGAPYTLIATVKDGFGQKATESLDFEVHWEEQALIPSGNFVIEDYVAKITPTAPIGARSTDVCDIYRLSADKPELIVKDAVFGQTYVDPYPAIGEQGGHRIVFKTQYGDYITEDNEFAWHDTDEDDNDIFEFDKSIIDFDGDRIFLDHNVDLNNKWDKDFQQKKYLGGSIVGDWNEGVKRTSTVTATMITLTEMEDIKAMRRLADYSGICHIRTTDGSSYPADIQVTEDRMRATYGMIVSFSLQVTRIESQELDGITLAEWEERNQDELE